MQQKRGIRQERSHSNRRNTKLQPRGSNLRFKIGLITSRQSILRSRIGPVILSQTDLGYRFRMLRLYESISRTRIVPTPTRPYRFRVRIRNAAIAGVHFTIQNWTLTIGAVHFTIQNWTQPNWNTSSYIYNEDKVERGIEFYFFVYSILQIYSIIRRAVNFWVSWIPTNRNFY